jgi:hypothetical protein
MNGHVKSHGPGEAGERQHEDRRQEPAEYGGGVEPPLHKGAIRGVGIRVPCGSLIERYERDDGIDGVKERIEAKDLTIATGWGAD